MMALNKTDFIITLPTYEDPAPYHLPTPITGHWSSTFNGQLERLAHGEAQVIPGSHSQKFGAGDMSSPEPIAGDIAICSMATRSLSEFRDAEISWNSPCNENDTTDPIIAKTHLAKELEIALRESVAIATKHSANNDLSFPNVASPSTPMAKSKETDSQQRQLLEVAKECLKNAGEFNYRDKLIGCYIGTFGQHKLRSDPEECQQHWKDSVSDDLIIANHTSFKLDLKGPSMVISSALSTLLVGLHEACRALRNQDCDGAVVIGINLLQTIPSEGTREHTREGTETVEN